MQKTSSNVLTIIARILTVLITAVFILTALAALILFNVERRAFNPATYKQALVSQGFYQQFPILVGDLLEKNISDSAASFTQQLTAKQWSTLIEALLPQARLQATTEEAINQFFAYLNGQTQNPQISLLPLKRSLASPAGVNAVFNIIQSLPDCTVQQVARIITSMGNELCNPPGEVLDLFRPILQAQLQATAAAIPDRVSILANAESNGSLQDGMKTLKTLRLAMRLSPLLPLALLLIITLLVVRTLKGWLAWWGWPFLLTGLPGMLIGFAGAPFFRLTAERMLSKRMTLTLPTEVVASLRAVLDATLREMLKPVAWEGLALAIIGLLMIVGSFYLRHQENGKIAASEAATQVF